MRIALDARTIYRTQRRGTGKNLIDLYRALAQARPDWEVVAYHRQFGVVDGVLPTGWVQPRCIEMPGDRIRAWDRWRLPAAAWRDKADLLHCPANHCPQWMPVDTVVTLHDLIPLDMPDNYPPDEVQSFRRSVQTACRRAAGIVCPSQYTRRRLIDDFHADGSRITVNPWPADSAAAPVPADMWAPVLRRYNVARPFVLHFGAADPRKNTAGVLEAWSRLPRHLLTQWKLLVVGLDPVTLERMTGYAAVRRLSGSVVLHGFADEADVPTLLSAAEMLAFPSLSEGYGLPILDAWATHTPVLTSNTTSLPEVADDAALTVDPYDAEAIAFGLQVLMEDTSLRARLVAQGRRRLARYSWADTAERFAQVMERAAGVAQPASVAA
ncbi:MAG: glycosyltransferase family 4 protein [Planctomycetes bacterium]|nr:glycosyltransferase family 4 protein [Planctomycetota bacterium]